MLKKKVQVIGVALGLALSCSWALAESDQPATSAVRLPKGLESYIEARVLEANGRHREAMDAYARAVDEAPENTEIRVSFATLLVDLGMAERAVGLLQKGEALDASGLRIRALAMTQLASRKPELLTETETSLRAAIEANEGDPNLLFSLAQVLQRTGKEAESEQIIDSLRKARPENPRLVVFHAETLNGMGRKEEALELYRLCAVDGPSAPSCRESLVELLVELGRPGEAGEVMLEWLRDIDLDSLMRAAGLLWEGGRLELSLETVRRVLVKAPNSERARIMEAHLLSALGYHNEAVVQLRKLLRKDPENIDLILALAWSSGRSGDHEEAREWFGKAWEKVEDDPGSQQAVRVALRAARLEVIEGFPLVAREWLNRVDESGPVGPDYVRLLAETYRRERQWQEGISAMVRVQPGLSERAQVEAEAMEAEFRLRIADPRAWRRLRPLLDSDKPDLVNLGLQVLQTVERWADVEREAATAIDRFGDRRDFLFARAAALERLDRFEEAEELFRQMVVTEPEDANVANFLGYMWADREVNLEEALELISRAVAVDPENPAYLDSLGWVHYRLGDLEQARLWLKRAIDLGGDVGDGTILCHLGEVLLASGERDEGRSYLQIGLDMGCDDPERVRSLLESSSDEPDAPPPS